LVHDKYENSGVYKLTYKACPHYYIGQTGGTFNIRYKEHMRNINNNKKTGYMQHILNTGHTYGSINDTMEIM
jgi:hypothetical protein